MGEGKREEADPRETGQGCGELSDNHTPLTGAHQFPVSTGRMGFPRGRP